MPETWSTSINQDSRLANHVKRHWSNGWCTHLLRKRPRFDSRRRQKQYTDVFLPLDIRLEVKEMEPDV